MRTIKQYRKEGILFVELYRPQVLNAINLQMMDELEDVFASATRHHDIKVIVLQGSGDRAFAAGGDLVEFHRFTSEDEAFNMLNKMAGVLDQIATSPKLTIAAINGLALGGGAELTTAFDIRLASETAKIGFVQRNLGLTTGWGGGSRLLDMLGAAKALPFLVSGEVTEIRRWFELGFVHQIYPASTFKSEVEAFAMKCAQAGAAILHGYKQMKNQTIDYEKLSSAIEKEVRFCAKLWADDEHRLAVERFLERKRT
jgi:enoyl-CoA hydratase/carnithine racemase